MSQIPTYVDVVDKENLSLCLF